MSTNQIPASLAAELGTIREMAAQITDDHTVADCSADLGVRCTGHDAERMADALEAAMATHPVHDNGIAAAWCVPCTKEAQASQLGSEPSVFVYAGDCKLRLAITAALTGEASTDGN